MGAQIGGAITASLTPAIAFRYGWRRPSSSRWPSACAERCPGCSSTRVAISRSHVGPSGDGREVFLAPANVRNALSIVL